MRYPDPVEALLPGTEPVTVSWTHRPDHIPGTRRLKLGWSPVHDLELTELNVKLLAGTGIDKVRLARRRGLGTKTFEFDLTDLETWPPEGTPLPPVQHTGRIARHTVRDLLAIAGRRAEYRFECSCGEASEWRTAIGFAHGAEAQHQQAVREAS